jgi:5-methyltetrahydropteroyltriglutamate--homocysteine methyltransferase
MHDEDRRDTGSDIEDAFISAASPGVISVFLPNKHYASEDEYLEALGDAMKPEYDAIHAAGFLVQLDCPDLAMGHHVAGMANGIDAFRDRVRKRVEVLNHPSDIRRTDPQACAGNYEGPHHHDVDQEIIDSSWRRDRRHPSRARILVRARGRVFEDGNLPRRSSRPG